MNVIATAFNGAQSECHGSTATKTRFGIQSSPLLETVSPDKLAMAAAFNAGYHRPNRAFKGDSSHHDVDGIGRSQLYLR